MITDVSREGNAEELTGTAMFQGFYDIGERPNHLHLWQDKLDVWLHPEAHPELLWEPGMPPILQWEWEAKAMLEIVRRLKPSTALEIGCAWGGTAYLWNQAMSPGGHLAIIDVNPDLPPRFQAWCETWKRPDVRMDLINSSSDHVDTVTQAHELFKDGLDFLFIDGRHETQFVCADFENYGPLVRPGGIIALHDIQGTWQVNSEVKGPPGLFRKCMEAGYVTRRLQQHREQDGSGIGVIYVEEPIHVEIGA